MSRSAEKPESRPRKRCDTLRLVEPNGFGGARLRPAFLLDQLGDLDRQLRLQHPLVGLGEAEIGEDISAAPLDFLDFDPLPFGRNNFTAHSLLPRSTFIGCLATLKVAPRW